MTQTHHIIENTFVEVMETLGFYEVISSHSPVPLANPILIDMKITMPYMGNFVVAFSNEIAEEITANFFADVTKNANERQVYVVDTLCEFVNVFGGKVMQQLYPHLAFRLGLPQKIENIPDEAYVMHTFVDPNGRGAMVYSCLEK